MACIYLIYTCQGYIFGTLASEATIIIWNQTSGDRQADLGFPVNQATQHGITATSLDPLIPTGRPTSMVHSFNTYHTAYMSASHNLESIYLFTRPLEMFDSHMSVWHTLMVFSMTTNTDDLCVARCRGSPPDSINLFLLS